MANILPDQSAEEGCFPGDSHGQRPLSDDVRGK
jgi:hypothetical protein